MPIHPRLAYRFILLAIAIALSGLSVAATSPYAGEEQRDIKSLSPQEVSDYLAGKGMGFAKAAELNGYPGPSHVLELADRLELTVEQRTQTEALFKQMQDKAIAAGKKLIEEERALNMLFASRAVTPALLRESLDRIAAHQADVRRAHLETHLAQQKILSARQIVKYGELRGYAGEGVTPHRHSAHDHAT
jgi:hypothetical protein